MKPHSSSKTDQTLSGHSPSMSTCKDFEIPPRDLEELKSRKGIEPGKAPPANLVVALATYNERENIAQLIPEILSRLPDAHVLVVDDSSPDGTGELADQMAEKDSRIRVMHRQGKLGLGTAIVAAFQWAIENNYDYIQLMDADFSHPPRFLPAIVEAGKSVDVSLGSRYVKGGEIEGWGLKRHFMSKSINMLARFILRLKTNDNSGNFRCYRTSKLKEVDWSRAICKGYGFQEEVLYRLRQAGATFAEVPIRFEERRFGSSKINMKEAIEAGLTILKLPFTAPITRKG